ncbi:MAG TPA: hypothetical protein VIF82_15840 [Burkholderiaceae bacterium]|jgi:hypothetical protein
MATSPRRICAARSVSIGNCRNFQKDFNADIEKFDLNQAIFKLQ